jgi:hypothetical protein
MQGMKHIMKKNLITSVVKKTAPAVITLGIVLASATAFLPAVASANDGIHLGLGLGLFHKMEKHDNDDNKANVNTDTKAFMSNNSVASAAQTYKTSTKQANTTYKAALQAARVKLAASLQAATDFTGKVAAFKTYLADKLAAYKAKSLAVEAAMQAFIDTNFTSQNQIPVANDLNVTVSHNTAANITLTGSDPENHALTFSVVSGPTHGTLSGTAPNLVYTPSTNFSGSDSFTFKVNDGTQFSTTKTVSITVNQ